MGLTRTELVRQDAGTAHKQGIIHRMWSGTPQDEAGNRTVIKRIEQDTTGCGFGHLGMRQSSTDYRSSGRTGARRMRAGQLQDEAR